MSAFQGTPEGALLFHGEQIANFLPRVECVFWDATRGANGPPAALQIGYAVTNRNNRQSVTISYTGLESFDFEFECPGCTCSNNKGKSAKKLVTRYIREQLGDDSLEKVDGVYYSLPGWHYQSSVLRYITGEQIIGPEQGQPHLIDSAIKQYVLATNPDFSPSESVEKLLSGFQHYPSILLPTFAFTIYASLRSILHKEGLPTSCILYLVGSQGFGKTTTAKNLCALWRNVLGQYTNVYDARSTEAAMMNALADARDQVILLDDICRTTDRTAQRKRKNLAATLVRTATNEIPITRMCGKREEMIECTAGLVITGEFPLEEASDLTRCVIVNINQQLTTGRDDLDRDVAASALAGYLQWFAEHSEQELNRLRSEYYIFKTKDRSHREERLQISLWELSWVFSSFLRFAEDIRAVSRRAAEQVDEELTGALHTIFSDTLQRLDKLNHCTMGALAPVIKAGAMAEKFPCLQRSGCLCVPLKELTKHLKEVTGNSSLDDKDVAAALRDQGLLLMDNSKKKKSTRKVLGKRMLTIPWDKL